MLPNTQTSPFNQEPPKKKTDLEPSGFLFSDSPDEKKKKALALETTLEKIIKKDLSNGLEMKPSSEIDGKRIICITSVDGDYLVYQWYLEFEDRFRIPVGSPHRTLTRIANGEPLKKKEQELDKPRSKKGAIS